MGLFYNIFVALFSAIGASISLSLSKTARLHYLKVHFSLGRSNNLGPVFSMVERNTTSLQL